MILNNRKLVDNYVQRANLLRFLKKSAKTNDEAFIERAYTYENKAGICGLSKKQKKCVQIDSRL